MATLTDIRSGLATRLGTISGLRTAATMPEQINPPIAVVSPVTVNYDLNAQNGLTQYTMLVTLVVARADARAAQNQLDSFVAPTGAGSVKAAIEADRTLGGTVNTCRVTQVANYSMVDTLDVPYLAVDFTVEVYD